MINSKEVELKKKLPVDLIADKQNPEVCYVVFEDNEINKFVDLELKQEFNVAFVPTAGDISNKGDILAIGDRVSYIFNEISINLFIFKYINKIIFVNFRMDSFIYWIAQMENKYLNCKTLARKSHP